MVNHIRRRLARIYVSANGREPVWFHFIGYTQTCTVILCAAVAIIVLTALRPI